MPIKGVLLHGSDILSPDGSRASDAQPSSEMSSSSTASCVSPDVMEGSSTGAILKPGGSTVFVCYCIFLAMVTVSLYLTCARA